MNSVLNLQDENGVLLINKWKGSIQKKVIKLIQLNAFDTNKNSFIVDLAYMDLNTKELLAKDVNLNFKIAFTNSSFQLKNLQFDIYHLDISSICSYF